MNGSSSKRDFKTSFRASPTSIHPIYTGGPVQLTRDGEWLVTTMSEEVLVTEVRTGRSVARIKGDTTPITALVLSYHTTPPTLITAHQSNTVRYYPLPAEVPTIAPGAKAPALQYTRALPRAANAPILMAAVSPDNTLLATGSSDGIVKVWDLAGGYVTHMFRGHGGPVSALHFSFPTMAKGEERQRMELWTGSTDTKVRVYDLRDATSRVVVGSGAGGSAAKPKAVLDGHVSVVRGIAVSEDGRWALTGGRDKVVLVWDLGSAEGKKGKAAQPKVVQTLLANEQVEALGLLPDGARVQGVAEGRLLCYTGGDGGAVRVWDVLKATEVAAMVGVEGVDEAADDEDEQHGVVSLIYDSSSAALVSVHADQNIIFHSLATLSPARQIVGFNDDIVDATFLSHDGSATQSHVALAVNSSLVRIYSTSTFDARLLSGHKDMVLCLDRSPDGRVLVTGSKDRTARVWVPSRGASGWKCVAVCEGHAEAVGAVALSRKTEGKGRFLFTASQDRTVKMWDLSSLDLSGGDDAASDDSDDDGEILKARSLATLRVAEKDINALDLAPNDRFLVTGSQDKLVKVFEIDFALGTGGAGASGAIKHIGTCKGHRRGVWSVRFSKNDRIVASGAADRTIKLWNLDDFTCLKTFEGHTNSVLRVDFMTQGKQLASSASDGLVKIWNIRDEECAATLDGHEDKVWALAIAPDEQTLLSAGADSSAVFWEDSSVAEQDEKNAKLIAAVQSEQDFNNYVAVKDYKKAITLALAMSQPGRLLSLFKTVLAASAGLPEDEDEDAIAGDARWDAGVSGGSGSPEIDTVLGQLSDLDLVRLLKHVRDWNANAKTAPVAQALLFGIFQLKTPDEIMGAFETVHRKTKPEDESDDDESEDEDEAAKKAKKAAAKAVAAPIAMRELLDGLIPYSQRHMARVDRLVQESYILDYTISEMDGGVLGGEVMEVD